MSPTRTPPRADGGFALVEALVTVLVLTIALGVALTGFESLSETSDGAALMADTNLNLRSALNVMTRDLLSAGRDIPVGGIAVPSGDGAVPIVRPSATGTALTFEAGATTLDSVTTGNALGPDVEGTATDVITILIADTTLALDQWPLADVAADGSTVTVDARTTIDDDATGVTAGDLVMFTTAGGSTLQMVTDRQSQTIYFDAGDPMLLNQRGAAQGTILNLRTGGVYPPMTATRVLMVSYYLDGTDPHRPLLMRRVNLRPDRAIGIAIENLQLTYDLVDGVTNPVNIAAPEAPNTADQIRKANVYLSGRSYREWRRTRQVLRSSVATQVSLRSLAFVDRYR